jgi:hypothetical protein
MKATGLMDALQLTAESLRVRNVLYLKLPQFLGSAPSARLEGLFICPVDEAAYHLRYGSTLFRRQFSQLAATLLVQAHVETFCSHVLTSVCTQ